MKGFKRLSYFVTIEGTTYTVNLDDRENQVEVDVDSRKLLIDMTCLNEGHTYSLLINNRSYTAVASVQGENREVSINGVSSIVDVEEEEQARLRSQVKSRNRSGGEQIKAPMPGRIVAVHAAVGDVVEAGKSVVVIEAMKMENELRTHSGGTIKEIRVREEETVNKNDILVLIQE